MDKRILGIHHVTAIAGDPQANLEFYAGVLGLRLVKLTVNYDDPGTYHLYYGDGVGHPGTIMTFFPWPNAPRGKRGTGQVTETAFAIPRHAVDFWAERLSERRIPFERFTRFGEHAMSFNDPDALSVTLIGANSTRKDRAYQTGPVPIEFAIRGFHSATLLERDHRKTVALLTDVMGFKLIAEEGDRLRYAADSDAAAGLVDVLRAPEERPGRVLAGSIHHIAWRTPDDEQQLRCRAELTRLSYGVSPVMDRKYFHSIYYREPGGILFEIATDPPGFTVDQPEEELGSKLVLPTWLEPQRKELQSILPPLRLPAPEEAQV